jgi:hypothetical protein
VRSTSQVKKSGGFLGGGVLADRHRTFWTMTLWDDQASMLRYMTTGEHKAAMPHLLDWCDEASVVHWEQPEATKPSWGEAETRMRSMGRVSKVRHPSPQHATLSFEPARVTSGQSIKPSRT